jgi:multiple sugar transport system substrate-binding protein
MFSEQREVLNEIIVKMHAGRITRRRFLRSGIVLPLISSIVPFSLESCDTTPNPPNSSGSSGGNSISITWESEYDDSGTYSQLVQAFNDINKDGIHVNYINGPRDTKQQHDEITAQLKKGQGPDILSMDVIWTDEFAINNWIVPLSDQYQWPGSERNKYLSGPLQAATYPLEAATSHQGKVWTAPFRTNVGLLYYLKDIITTPPKTWAELTTLAEQAQVSGRTKYGYIWQGAPYEGLICNFVEVLESFGGHVLDPHDPTKVMVSSPEAVQALTTMVDLIWSSNISPLAITTFKEGDTLSVWKAGDAAFMRHWPSAYSESSDASQSRVAGKFDVAALPSSTPSTTGHSCIGGWQLAINAYSRNKDAAWKFIHNWMLQEDAQQFAAIDGSFTVTLQSIYQNSYVRDSNPFFAKLGPIFQQARLRPRLNSSRYQDVSNAILKHVYEALTRQSKPADALNALQAYLQPIVSNGTTSFHGG